jgi:hypothetical protein
MASQGLRVPDTIRSSELTPIPPLLEREGDQGGEFSYSYS